MITPIAYEDVVPFIKQGQREKLAGFSREAFYYGYYIDGRLAGFTSIQYYGPKAKFNNHYVFKEHRRKGILRAMLDFSIEEVRRRGVKEIVAACTDMSLPEYLRRGAVVEKQYKICTNVRLTL